MPIKIFISIMRAILKGYQKAYAGKYDAKDLDSSEIDLGICLYVKRNDNHLHLTSSQRFCFVDTFTVYYKHLFVWGDYLFRTPLDAPENERYKHLKPRIDFLESEIKRLKNLQKKGYTHI